MDLGIGKRIALITGGDSGIGFESARMLLEEGTTVIVSDKDRDTIEAAGEKLRRFAKEQTPTQPKVFAVAADLTEPASVKALHDTVLSKVGQPQILVNCAGVTGATGLFHEIDEEGWRTTLDIDFFAAVRLVKAFIEGMRESGWGRIVLTASEDAVQPYIDELPYCAAKAAVLSLTKGLSKTYARHGVLVNAVSPAYIQTPMTDAMMQKRAKEKGTSFDDAVRTFLDEERPFIELKRRGRVEEVAAAIVFLCSERASFVNGSNYRVDGGSVATI
ncbi:SDR family NAD(P)-dependent oxidoreductase [Robbsia andropogonis]|uniref:SDR family NAD(P)-dependent oxidoreductase n=1 Tax=Robbsia andropogonis TaxID=28092 RepID=UPI0004678D3A|nr:SDR family oxidoreductase [Robbsia andropogonis]MCP1118631.1 SDR family oxidoreductase [Robbsia andropogonis]MCP1128098.1 SDR family oxidoreductase [Robbsia andropogonis]